MNTYILRSIIFPRESSQKRAQFYMTWMCEDEFIIAISHTCRCPSHTSHQNENLSKGDAFERSTCTYFIFFYVVTSSTRTKSEIDKLLYVNRNTIQICTDVHYLCFTLHLLILLRDKIKPQRIISLLHTLPFCAGLHAPNCFQNFPGPDIIRIPHTHFLNSKFQTHIIITACYHRMSTMRRRRMRK